MIKKWRNNKDGSFPVEKVQFLKAGCSTDEDRLHLDVHEEIWVKERQPCCSQLITLALYTSLWLPRGRNCQIGLIKMKSIVKTRNIMELAVIWLKSCFFRGGGEKGERLHLGKHAEATAQDAGKVGMMTTKLVACPSIKGWAVSRLLVRIRWGQHNADGNCVETCWGLNLCGKNKRKNVLHTLSNGRICKKKRVKHWIPLH